MGWWVAFSVLAVLRLHRLVGWSWWWVVTPLMAQTVVVGVSHALGSSGPLGPSVALLELAPGVVAWAAVFNFGSRGIPRAARPEWRPIEKLGVGISVVVHFFFLFVIFSLAAFTQPGPGGVGDLVVGGLLTLGLLGVFHALAAAVRHVYRRAHEPPSGLTAR
jgi:hypothetical protein